MSKESASSGGIGFAGLLTIVFVTLKLLEKIDWSWWWVLSPIWIPMCIFLAIVLIALVVVTIGAIIAAMWKK